MQISLNILHTMTTEQSLEAIVGMTYLGKLAFDRETKKSRNE